MSRYEKALPVGKTGNYTLTVSGEWLGSEQIVSFNVTAPDGGFSVGATTVSSNVIQSLLTGLQVGTYKVHFEFATATRSDCYTAYVDVIEC